MGSGRGRGRGKNTAVAGQKSRAMLGRDRARAVAWQASSAPYCFFFLSIAPEKGTLVAHKNRSGITYVTYMVVTPLAIRETMTNFNT